MKDHLFWQMHLTPFSETDQAIALAIINTIDESSYLTQSAGQLLSGLDDEYAAVILKEIKVVIKRIQHFDQKLN